VDVSVAVAVGVLVLLRLGLMLRVADRLRVGDPLGVGTVIESVEVIVSIVELIVPSVELIVSTLELIDGLNVAVVVGLIVGVLVLLRLPLRLSVEEPLTVPESVVEGVAVIVPSVEVLDEVKEVEVVAVPVKVEERLVVASVIESVTLCIFSLRDELSEKEGDLVPISSETDFETVTRLSENDPLFSSEPVLVVEALLEKVGSSEKVLVVVVVLDL
jgi:hypothetical protein